MKKGVDDRLLLVRRLRCATGNVQFCAGAAFGATYGSTKNLALATIAGITAGAFSGLNPVDAFFVGGIAGSISSYMAGQDPLYGFMGGAIGGATGGNDPSIGGMLFSMMAGGTLSEMTGGKFANGAASAAFSYAMSWAASKYGAGGVSHDEGECAVCANTSSTEAAGATWGMKNPNAEWADKINVTTLEDGTVLIKGKLTVSGKGAKQIAADVNAVYNGAEGEYEGVRYRSEIEMTAVKKNGDYQSRYLNGAEKKMFNSLLCDKAGWRAVGAWNSRGSSTVAWNSELRGWNTKYYAAHEFGHALGLNHAPPGSLSVLSYDFNKGLGVSLQGRNMADLANGYRR